LVTLIAVIVVVAGIFALITDTSKLDFLLTHEDKSLKIWFFTLFGLGAASLIAAWAVQNIPYNREQAKKEAAQTQAAAAVLAAQAKLAKQERLINTLRDEISVMSRDLEHVKSITTRNRDTITFGYSPVRIINGVASSTFEASVMDEDGKRLAYVVVYLFPEAAFWKYFDHSDFENLEGAPLRFLNLLEQEPFASKLKANQQLIAVGLESSARTDSTYSYRRAALLCGALFAQTDGLIPVYGLDLGQYGGPRLTPDSLPERRQRSVVMIGMRDIAQGERMRPLLPEILNLVAIPGVDLRNYSRADNPAWIETRNCDGPRL
jgi:hypothetical protein